MPKYILAILIAASLLSLTATAAKADGETWCKVGDPNDTYVNKRYPANGRITGTLNNGSDIWVAPANTKTDGKGLRWIAVIRNDKSGEYDYILARFTYNCRSCTGRGCSHVELND